MSDAYFTGMARDYIELIEAMADCEPEDLPALDAQRQVLHNQMLEYLGQSRATIVDMRRYCANALHAARAQGRAA
jgi:hypothetical protein